MSDKPRAYKLKIDAILTAEARTAIKADWDNGWKAAGITPPPPLFLCQRGCDIVPLDPADEKPAENIPEPTSDNRDYFRSST